MSDEEGTSRALVPSGSQEVIPFQELGQEGQGGDLALPARPTFVSALNSHHVDSTIEGGVFKDTNFGPVTNRNQITNTFKSKHIENQTIIYTHHYHYGADKSNEPSTSGSQARQEGGEEFVLLTGSIKLFKKKKLHKTKMICKGEKATVGEPIPVVVKLLNHSENAEREAKSLHSIDFHPNVVRIYDSGIHNAEIKYIFIAMELCTTETLFDYVSKNRNFNPRQAIGHSFQIISGLEYIHGKNILHRDLKPDNILFSLGTGYDQVKITDFGMSKNYITNPHATTRQFGTLGYVSPEIIKGKKPDDQTKCDIFSLGVLLVFILSNGKHPYGEERWQWNFNIAAGKEPNLRLLLIPNKNQLDAIRRIIFKLLQHDPKNRPTAPDTLKSWVENVGEYVEAQAIREVASSSQRNMEDPRMEYGDDNSIALTGMETRVKVIEDNDRNVAYPYPQKRRRTVASRPSRIVGIAMSNHRSESRFKVLLWKSIRELKHIPKEIAKTPADARTFSIVAVESSIKLLALNKACYELDLSDVTEGFRKLDSMKHDHGLVPPAAVLNGKVYACGMWSHASGGVSKKCEVLDQQWSDIADMMEPRNGNCVVSFQGCLYSMGGVGENGHPLCSVERYDSSNNTWELIQPLKINRYRPQAVVYKGKLYVIGGDDIKSNWIPSFECFDPNVSSWTLHTSAWWENNKPCLPFVFDNKVLSLLFSDRSGYRTIGQVPLDESEDENDLVKEQLPGGLKLYEITAL